MWYIGGIRACLKACGMDDDTVQLVICLPDVAETVTRNPLIKHITCGSSSSVAQMRAHNSHR